MLQLPFLVFTGRNPVKTDPQADHFIDCLLRGVESHCNLADAAKTHEVVFAALECYRTGRPVKLPLA